ncbi:hypothetical protein ACFFK0_07610 [Paenibacillus chartarius]|uniref:Uncharacterized protein n=1 Tax=Paenibacillus chartarius TaxID=747481 RepID=A0ABV6DIA4_9BACL
MAACRPSAAGGVSVKAIAEFGSTGVGSAADEDEDEGAGAGAAEVEVEAEINFEADNRMRYPPLSVTLWNAMHVNLW